jgi:hypothetical protein
METAPEIVSATLPASMSLQQATSRVAAGICQAYAAYNNGSNNTPVLTGYHGIQQIFVYEIDPNGNPFSSISARFQPNVVSDVETVPRLPAAYALTAAAGDSTCIGQTPVGTPSIGYQLFGFTATADDLSHNLLVFRGTVTMEEAGYALLGWGTNTQCQLPTQSSPRQNYGNVNSSLFKLYKDKGLFGETSLATSCMNAVAATAAGAPNIPWLIGGHSLGGALITLAALDAAVSGAFAGSPSPYVCTFGSLHVGVKAFADSYKSKLPATARVANNCDFVPSMVSLEPVTLAQPYVHVGVPATFVWQTWDDWGNHSLANIYQPVVNQYWNVLQWGDIAYPPPRQVC